MVKNIKNNVDFGTKLSRYLKHFYVHPTLILNHHVVFKIFPGNWVSVLNMLTLNGTLHKAYIFVLLFKFY